MQGWPAGVGRGLPPRPPTIFFPAPPPPPRQRAASHTHLLPHHTTTVPKVFRTLATLPGPSAFLCRPDGSSDPVRLSSSLQDYIPRSGTCSQGTTRSKPYVKSGPGITFETLHPEEAAWLPSRQAKTTPAIEAFVNNRLANSGLPPLTGSNLKVAVANSGGGKRALLHSLGVNKALFDLGVLDHASWMTGLSGGAWFVTALYSAMLQQTSVIDPETVFNDIRGRIQNTLWGDDFEANAVSQGASSLAAKQDVYSSTIPSLSPPPL